ncbi:hypothetical protein PMF13cell1_04466 [Blautia producta]|uniref:Phage tail tape measure protein n=1 Tax=Blautia producta TaxID=33035 RepID=A0A4P6M608_9FIRM|nr:hypothetical protein [Blautia producta]QBE98897.1 hypothetical protein PMF13cell1_04466 [Blautia producta]
MAQSVGQIGLDLVVNQNQFKKQMSGITNLAKKAGAALAAAFAVKKLVDFGKQCIELGSDLAEAQNVVDVTFPRMSAQVDSFAKNAAASFGLSETMAKKFTGTFGAMAKAFGFSEQQAYDMSTTLTGLAGDVASFYNISQDEAYTKLKSVFTGETETLKDLGIVMTQNALDAYAMANGWGKTTQAMSEAEKVALRYAFVQEQLTAASGDFTRTADSWANQVRVLKLQFDSLKATLGQGLINVLTPVLKLLNQLLAKLTTVATAFKSFTEMLTGKKSQDGSGFKDTASDLSAAAGAADSLTDSTEGVGKAAEKASRSLMGFDKVNKLQDKNASLTGGAGDIPIKGMDINYGNLAEGDTVIDQLDSKFQKMFQNIQRNIQPTIDSFKRLWNEGLQKLGSFTQTALGDFFSGFLGKVAGWLFQTGIPGFVDALNEGLMAIKFDDINEALNRLWDALAPFAINIGEGLLWFWQNVLVPLGVWTANEVVPRFLDTLAIAVEAVNNILEALKPLFQWFWDNVLKPIASWAGGIFLSVWDKINGGLQKFSDWCKEHPTAIQNMAIIIGSFFAAWKISSLIAKAAGFIKTAVNIVSSIKSIAGAISLVKYGLSLLTSAFNPVILVIGSAIAIGVLLWKNWDTIKEKAIAIWTAIATWFDSVTKKIGEFFSRLWSGIADTFKSVGSWFKQKFTSASDGIKSAFSSVGNFFSGIWSGIKNTFSNVADWFRDKFSAAWKAVKDVFSSGGKVFDGIKDGILNGLKSVVNALISGINKVIKLPFDGLNSALKRMKKVDIMGLKPFGWIPSIKVPQIPKLAQGGFVKANTPQLAMIGDNRHYGEIVAPEDKLQAMVNEAVRAAGGSGLSKADVESIVNSAVTRFIAAVGKMGFFVDGELLARALDRALENANYRQNPVEVT